MKYFNAFKKSWVSQIWKDTFCFRSDEDFTFTRMSTLDLKRPLTSAFIGWTEDFSSSRYFIHAINGEIIIQRNLTEKIEVPRSIVIHHRVYNSLPFGQLLPSEGILWRLSVKPGRLFNLQPVEHIFTWLVYELWTSLSVAALCICIYQLMALCHEPSNCWGLGVPLALVKFKFILFLHPSLSPCKFMTC